MNYNIKFLFLTLVLFSQSLFAQETFPTNGAPNTTKNTYAFTNATIQLNATEVVVGTLLIKGENVIAVGPEVIIPSEAIIVDVKDKFIYPSFIDPFTSYGMPKAEKESGNRNSPQYESNKKGAYGWNDHIQSEINAADIFKQDKKAAKRWINAGFGVVSSHVNKGLMTGTSVVSTLKDAKENETIIAFEGNEHLSFNRSDSRQSYPNSLMGRIALIKQTYHDVNWYASAEQEEKNISLQAILDNKELTQIFECKNKLDVLRADKIGDEFGIQYIFKGSGDEYQRISEIKATNGKLIVPLNFPKVYEVGDYYNSLDISLGEMQHWKMAPKNPSILANNNLQFAFTLDKIEEGATFLTNLRKAVKKGLTEEQALSALTEIPASIINVQNKVGRLEVGQLANFLICSGNLFDDKTKIHENWIQGVPNKISPLKKQDISGRYSLNVDNVSYEVKVTKEGPKYTAHIVEEDPENPTKVNLKIKDKSISLMFTKEDKLHRLSGQLNGKSNLWNGNGQVDSKEIKWHAIQKSGLDKDKKPKKEKDPEKMTVAKEIPMEYPLGGYGWDSIPDAETVLFRRANIWTNEAEGILMDQDVLIHDGKIFAIGPNLKASEILPKNTTYRTVIAKDMALTAGIIDEHSHIAIERGVNESGQASTAEVRIGDVIDSDDIDIYRQLAGGVTTSQLLHGSANPIGGQSAIIKLRWGKSPEQMKFENADGFIKFALGENVKQSNWGDANTTRFPQTRMGVEQVYYDHFLRAKAYDEARNPKSDSGNKKRKKGKIAKPKKNFTLRTDLELEALSEILNKKRFISCHSYVQSEINMLMNVADSMNFTINTFTHILEGYKLADKLKSHGANASTFSDWWAYKFEVNDAIPYNAALLHERGLNVAINSDDAEMGRRLNQEAAKIVKYGGVSEEEAWKMVTLNPAIMLHIDDRVGSIKIGKDADIVLWTGNPLSIYSKVEMTYIDGIPFYELERDAALREKIKIQRADLIKEMISEKSKGASSQKMGKKINKNYHCDDEEEL